MQQKASPAVIAAAIVVLVAFIGWYGFRNLAKPSAGTNPYANHKGPPPGMSGGGTGGGQGYGSPGPNGYRMPTSSPGNTGGTPGGN